VSDLKTPGKKNQQRPRYRGRKRTGENNLSTRSAPGEKGAGKKRGEVIGGKRYHADWGKSLQRVKRGLCLGHRADAEPRGFTCRLARHEDMRGGEGNRRD